MEDEKRLFYEKLDEYESKLPQKYDREKFVLSSEKYNLILECLSTKKGIKAPGGARFKQWANAISVNEIFLQHVDKTDIFTYVHIYDCLYDILWNTASSPSDMNISVYYT
jgi:hypothetical protein